MGRAWCPTCRRPAGLCVCDVVVAAPHATPVTIVQHPRERAHPFGTARLARRALQRAEVVVAWPSPHGLRVSLDLPPGAALLYPTEDAVPIELAPRPSHLVVLDGTWALVRQLLRDNPALAALPRVRLAPDRPGAYRIRREPAAHCLSTVESITAALAALEPDNAALVGVLAGFTALVDRQLAHLATVSRVRRRAAPAAGVRDLLAERDRVVVVYAEVLRGEPPHLFQWAARRPDGETFDLVVRPVHPAPAGVVAGMGLADAPQEPLAEGLARWAAFSRPDDVLVAWSDRTPALFAQAGGHVGHVVDLKSAWCNAHRGPTGTLPELVARLGLPVSAVSGVAGRAARRLGCASAVVDALARRPDYMQPVPGPLGTLSGA